MDVEEIKRVIKDQREEIEEKFRRTKIVDRNVPKEILLRYLSAPNILAILGVRRCGKTTFSLMLTREKYGYVDFDDERLYGVQTKDLNNVLQAFYELYGKDLENIVLDEVHNVPGWELFANRLRRTKKVILSGSNAKMLAGELATHLTGRYMDFTLYPFSFTEHLMIKDIKPDIYSTKSIAEVKTALSEYIKTGGFPECHIFGAGIVSKVYEDIIHKDIIQRHKIKDRRIFSEFAKYMVSSFSKEVTFRQLKHITSIKNVSTIRKYVDYLESAYLIFLVNRFSFKLKEQMKAPKKVYCIDAGIVNSVAFKFSGDMGRLMENLVAVELMRRNSYAGGGEIYYWKDHQQREVDFVVKKGESVESLIQVSCVSSRIEIEEREIKSIIKASQELRCKNMLLITWDYQGEINGIRCIPLWKWLLK